MVLSGKTAVVTGGAKGIGKEIVRSLIDAGAKTFAVGRSQVDLDAATSEFASTGRFEAVSLDVTQYHDIESFRNDVLTKTSRVDILVNNAGTAGPTTPVVHLEPMEWNHVLESNLSSVFYCSQVFAQDMMAHGGGTIINISSVSGKKPLLHRAGYCAAKMGVIGLTRAMAMDLGKHGITVNAISPGYVEGPRMEGVIAKQAEARGISFNDALEEFAQLSPLGRLVSPTDVAAMVVYLCSEAGRNITGQDIDINAGVWMN